MQIDNNMKKIFKIILIVASVLVVIYLIVIGTTLIQMQSAFSRNENKVTNSGDVTNKTIDAVQNFGKTEEYKRVKQINNVDSTLKYFQNYINSEK